MKERIVINQDWLVKDMKAGVPELDKLFICQKVEQVPETFEELKELCKKYNGKDLFVADTYIEVGGALVHNNMVFTNDGAIFLNTDCFKEKATPQQMWQIIKNLVEER